MTQEEVRHVARLIGEKDRARQEIKTIDFGRKRPHCEMEIRVMDAGAISFQVGRDTAERIYDILTEIQLNRIKHIEEELKRLGYEG